MKKIVLYSVLFVFLTAAPAFAGGNGSTLIPSYRVFNATSGGITSIQYVILQLSNISTESVDVEVWFYKNSGTDKVLRNTSPTSINYEGGATSVSRPTTAGNPSISFTLASGQSQYMFVQHDSSTKEFGYGEIKWTSSSNKVRKALIGSAKNFMSQQETAREMGRGADLPLNGGMPF